MARTKNKGTRKRSSKAGESTMVRKDANKMIEVSMHKFAEENYARYGRAVLENRAIPDYRDGLNPVNRRVLWAAHSLGFDNKSKLSKSARIVGDVIGRYHPHGDAAAYEAMVKMTNLPNRVNNIRVGLIEGGGNWGSLSGQTAAAARYTEARLSRFSDVVLFNKFYTPVMQKVPNFDSTTVEPLVLPSLLPLLFLNGRFGIAPGATTNIPAFEGKSIISLLSKAYAGEEITPKILASTLRVVTVYGGIEDSAGRKSEGRKALFKTKRGKIHLLSSYEYDEKKRTMTFDKFAVADFEKSMEKGLGLEGVQSVYDLSKADKKNPDRYGRLVFTLKKQIDNKHKKTVAAIINLMSANENYVLNFTRRYKDELGQAAATMRSMTLVQAFTSWIKWRTNLEKKACSYWIKQDEKEIHRLGLLMQAVDLIDFIVSLLKDKKLKSNDEVYAAYAKKAKVELEDAKYVMGRPIISLRNLEKAKLQEQQDAVKANKAKLEKRKAKPLPHMLKQLEEFAPFFKHEGPI
jgi:DNA gyrase/topoisomerase IV subunit A